MARLRSHPRKFLLGPQRLFLIDGIGALLTAFLLGVVLANFEDSFGMPRRQLYILSAVALVFAIYSLSCCLWVGKNGKRYLKAIAIANLAYCGLSIGVVCYNAQSLTLLGWLYFPAEIVVVSFLAWWELRNSSRLPRSS